MANNYLKAILILIEIKPLLLVEYLVINHQQILGSITIVMGRIAPIKKSDIKV